MCYQFCHWLRVRDGEDRVLNRYFVIYVMVVNAAETVYLGEYVQHAQQLIRESH